jgi:FixJ family two-component response regulator
VPDAAVISRVLKAAVAHTVQLPPNMNAMGFTVPDSVVVHVIEDDQPSRIAASRLLKQAGYAVRAYSSGAEFLADMPEEGGCIVLDFQLPGSNGLELQEHLMTGTNPLPIVFLTGHGDVPKSVRAMKAGAIDFLTKPVEGPVLLDAVARAIARDLENRVVRTRQQELHTRYERLTRREREVFAHLISGQLNKQVGFDLGISERTTKIHRHQVLDKMEADSIADLVRMAADLGITPAGKVR